MFGSHSLVINCYNIISLFTLNTHANQLVIHRTPTIYIIIIIVSLHIHVIAQTCLLMK